MDWASIEKYFNNLKNNKASRPDGIVSNILIIMKNVFAEYLRIIFVKSFVESTVPEDWKNANIVPLYKKNDKSHPSNYRPVSLPSHLYKVLKSLLKYAIVDHLNKYSLISSSQHGFTAGRSCLTNLLQFFVYVSKNIDIKVPVDILHLNFSKVLDQELC